MRILVIGYGSIGKRHVRNLQMLLPQVQIEIYDPLLDLDVSFSHWFSHIIVPFLPDAAIIASPTEQHISQAFACTLLGIPIYLEKPVCSLPQLDDFGKILQHTEFYQFNNKCAVGHQYRFAISWPEPHTVSELYFEARDNLGHRYRDVGEAVAAHPIDTSLWQLGKAIHVDLHSYGSRMWGKIIHEHGTSHHDYDMAPSQILLRKSTVTMRFGNSRSLDEIDLPPDNDMYLATMKAWLDAVRGEARDKRLATLKDGLEVVKVLAKVNGAKQ